MARDFDTKAETVTGGATDQVTGLDQLMDSDSFKAMIQNEFPEDAPEWLDPVTRRQFVTVMGASLAMAGVVGCNPSFRPAPSRKAIPYVSKPEAIIPGLPLFFATAATLSGYGIGVIAKSQEGRPLKVEGNPSHPASLGGCDLYTQSSILNLYDPDRAKDCSKKNAPVSWDAVRSDLAKVFTAAKETNIRLLTETITSPTLLALISDEFLKAYPKAKWTQYDSAKTDSAVLGAKSAFGKALQPIYAFDKAKVVLTLDSDVLTVGPGAVRYARDFASKRKVRVYSEAVDGVKVKDMSRVYSVESMLTATGASADHRLPLKPTEIESFTRTLAAAVGVANAPKSGTLPKLAEDWIAPLVEDLKKAEGAVVVVAGDHLPWSVHALVHAINEKLGAYTAKTVTFIESVEKTVEGKSQDIKALAAEMKAGAVDTLVIIGGNPVYDAPADLDFAEAMKKVKTTITLSTHEHETGALSTLHINEAHYLESWGDVRSFEGTASIQQPLIASVYGGKNPLEVLAVLLGKDATSPLELVKETWKKYFEADAELKKGNFDLWWDKCLEQGVVAGTASKPVAAPAVSSEWFKDAPIIKASATDELEITFRPDPTIYDGRFANNGWLQELPKPITKITWDNAIIASPSTVINTLKGNLPNFKWTGGEHGRSEVDIVEIEYNGRKVKAAVWALPGHADGCITFHLGYGRTRAGKVGNGTGFNAGAIRTSDAMGTGTGVKVPVLKNRDKYFLGCTQGQHAMEGRRPSRHGTVADVKRETHEYEHTWKPFDFADNPAAAAAEKDLMRKLLPGSPQELDRLGLLTEAEKKTRHQSHGDDHDHKHEHDKRLVHLSLLDDGPHKQFKTYRRWGMAIDLSACIGCSACVAACVAENNIPVVGKTEVTRGRAMHWIRVDRYFAVPEEKGGTEKVEHKPRNKMLENSASVTTHFQPLPCQQCEKAPCEIVCPVGATVHSTDGLNDMAYNRCVGTRYCSNNCPYKVRRFNFLQYADYATDAMKLVNNPEVTVRTRGVMEKCTYCVQRIRTVEIEAEREWEKRDKRTLGTGNSQSTRPVIKDGEVVTACQSACPSGAIAFGDINDPDAKVRKWKLEPTHYGLLAELNTMPRTTYLAAVKNPNPKMPGVA